MYACMYVLHDDVLMQINTEHCHDDISVASGVTLCGGMSARHGSHSLHHADQLRVLDRAGLN